MGKVSLDTQDDADMAVLRSMLQRRQKRNQYKSTVLNFDSERAITNIQPFNPSWDIRDPFEEEVGWDLSYYLLRDRFTDVRHSLFRLMESQRRKIADLAERLMAEGKPTMQLNFSDPLADFKSAFSQLLAPKRLVDVNAKDQQIYYE